jgi:hypothetical protein
LVHVLERFEFNGITRGVFKEHSCLLSREAFKADVRLDLEFNFRCLYFSSDLMEHVPGQNYSKMGNWDHVAVYRVARPVASMVRAHTVRNYLVAKEIKILPLVRSTAHFAT